MSQAKPIRIAELGTDQRGMALFMVMMVLTIVSGIGIFAARAASQTDLGAGQAKHALQAQYAAEFAMRALAADIAMGPDVYLQTLQGDVGERDNCFFNENDTCTRMETGDVLVKVIDDQLPGGLLGELSHADIPGGSIVGSFSLEMDNLSAMSGSLAGYNRVRTFEVTVLAVGQVMPAGAPAGVCTAKYSMASGLQKVGGQITFGPFPE